MSLGIPAVAVTSQHSPSELAKVMAAMPRACLIYAAPERFDNAMFHTMLSVNPPWLVAVDESHSVGEAGLSFRPAYRFVRDFLDRRNTGFDTQWLAVTASATEEVVQDIRDTFRMQQARLIRLSCDRPNLSYRVHIGKQYVTQNSDGSLCHSKLQKLGGYDSTHGKKGSWLARDEYIVYTPQQCTIEYLVEVEGSQYS
jgi:ATP-dependent DNA helicase RecQ